MYRLLGNLRFSNTPALRHQAQPPLREPGPSVLIPSLLSPRAFPEEAILAGPLWFSLRSVTSPAPCSAQNQGLRPSQTLQCSPERSHACTPSRESPLQFGLEAATHHFPLQQCKLQRKSLASRITQLDQSHNPLTAGTEGCWWTELAEGQAPFQQGYFHLIAL